MLPYEGTPASKMLLPPPQLLHWLVSEPDEGTPASKMLLPPLQLLHWLVSEPEMLLCIPAVPYSDPTA